MFTYLMPTKIIVGENSVKMNSAELILGTKAIIVTGKSSGRSSGALADVTDVLENANIPFLIYDRIGNNPTVEETAEGGKAAREFGADFVIGIGGGSPLDAAKAVATYAVNEPVEGSDFELYDIFDHKYKNKPLPMAAIPTTAGTGSETTPYSILTSHKEQTKRNFGTPDVFFKVAFLDGRYTVNLPLQIARNTAVDAMCHLLEGYTDTRATMFTDYIAIEGLRIIAKHFDRLKTGDFDVECCTDLLWASTLGGILIAQTGTTIVHAMGYPLTYYKDIPHGMANGLLLAEYLRHTQDVLPEKTRKYLETLGMKSVDEVKILMDELLPCDVEFNEHELIEWSKKTVKTRSATVCPFAVTAEMEAEMFKNSLL